MTATRLVAEVLRDYTPGDGWSWDEEEADLHSHACYCVEPAATSGAAATCPIPGHYQKRLEEFLKGAGGVTQPICLGNDGRIWDGHHRLVAARRLGFKTIPVEAD